MKSLLLLGGLIACTAQDHAAGADAGTGPDGGCAVNEVPLLGVAYGETSRYFVAAELEGREVALQLDTGSSLTFLYQGPDAPAFTPELATLTVGCETLVAAGRNLSGRGDRVGEGLEVVGLLGMDFLLARPSLLDVEALEVARYAELPRESVEAARLTVSFDDVLGHALVPLTLDETPVRLMLDTGAGDTLWVGQEGRPGDEVVYVEDAEGAVFPIYVGEASLAFPGGPPRTVPVARAPEFPYFEQTIAALGGNLHGLLGVTAFPGERLLVSGSESRIYVLR